MNLNPLGVLVVLAGAALLYLGIKGKQSSPAIKAVVAGTKK